MARYGAITYGDGTKYGASALVADSLTWALEIDWDDDEYFDGQNEGKYIYGLTWRRGREFLIGSDGDGFEPVMVGEATIVLRNNDGRYDAYNEDGPLYPNVSPLKLARLRVKDNETGIVYPVIAGILQDIQPVSATSDNVRLTIRGTMANLQQQVTVPLQMDLTVAQAIAAVLEEAGWPDIFGTAIDGIIDILPYFWAEDERANSVLQDLSDAYLGTFFEAADGKATYYSRNHIAAAKATLTGADIGLEVSVPQPWEVLRNIIKVDAYPRIEQVSSELWRLLDTPYVAAGAEYEVWANFTFGGRSVPATDLSETYSINTAIDGGGVNLTASFSVTREAFSSTAKYTVTNNGAVGGYITSLIVDGVAIDAPNKTSFKRIILAKRPRTFVLGNKWLQNTTFASNVAKFLSSFLGNSKAYPRVKPLPNPANQFGIDLFDTVAQTIADKNISSNFKVGYIEAAWIDQIGQKVDMVWRLEPARDLTGYWQFKTPNGVQFTSPDGIRFPL